MHQHYHHRESTDAIIELTLSDSTPDWRLRTLRNLYRKVITLRRTRDEARLSDALGVLAYSNVFIEIFNVTDFSKDGVREDVPSLPKYHPDELKESIKIRRDSSRRHSERRKTDAQFVIGSLLTLAIIYSALLPLLSPHSAGAHVGDLLIRFISNRPYVLLSLPVVFFFFYRWYVRVSDIVDIRFVRTIYRLLAWLPRNGLVLLGVIASVLFALTLAFSVWKLLHLPM